MVGYSINLTVLPVSTDLTHCSALTEAILQRDMAPTVQLLLEAGADVNLQGGYYGCPLAVSF